MPDGQSDFCLKWHGHHRELHSLPPRRASDLGYEERIFLQGDTNAAYGEVLGVMTQMKNAGFTNIALVTDPKSRVEGAQ